MIDPGWEALDAPAQGALAPLARRSANAERRANPLQLGPLSKVYLFWLAGLSCEGCTVAAVGATHPRIEQLLTGEIPGLPRVELVHVTLSVESGAQWLHNLEMAERGELDAPYVLTWEGSVPDERSAGAGYWAGLGTGAGGEQATASGWLRRLAPGAAALIAVGTCATWGGVPAGAGTPTGATGVGSFLGDDYRSAAGLPVVNIPGCAPIGDNYTETVAGLLLALNNLAPLPEFDELGRPAWLFGGTVHSQCDRLAYYDEGVFASEAGATECLIELGCWGPVVQCNIAERGVVDGHGGCMSMGGICIGCTMPGFPDRFTPSRQQALARGGAGLTGRVRGSFLRRRPAAGTGRPAPARPPRGSPAGPPRRDRPFYRCAPRGRRA